MGFAMSMCGQKVSPVTDVGCEKAAGHDGPHGILYGTSPVTSPRTPRQWNAEAEEPADRPEVLDREGRTWRWSKHAGFAGAWIRYVGGTPLFWNTLAKFYGPLSEVLPETPEPPRDLRAEATRWAVGQALARGEEIEIPGMGIVAPDEEPPPEDLFPSALAERCYFEGCPEWITGSSDYCPTHAKLYAPVPASQSVPAVPVSSTGGTETGEAAETGTEADGPSPWDAYVAAYRAYQGTARGSR